MVVAPVGCSEYAPRLNVDYEDSSYHLNPVFPHTLAMLSITGSVVTTSVYLGDYFSIVGGFLHGGVTPAGRVHLWLSRVVFGNIGDLGRVEGSACRFRGVLSNCVDPGEMTKKMWRFRIYPFYKMN